MLLKKHVDFLTKLCIFSKDQVYSNIRVPTRVNTNLHGSTRVRHESTQINTSPTQVRHESTRINTSQHDSNTSQHEAARVQNRSRP